VARGGLEVVEVARGGLDNGRVRAASGAHARANALVGLDTVATLRDKVRFARAQICRA
jgi:hypothetical protein